MFCFDELFGHINNSLECEEKHLSENYLSITERYLIRDQQKTIVGLIDDKDAKIEAEKSCNKLMELHDKLFVQLFNKVLGSSKVLDITKTDPLKKETKAEPLMQNQNPEERPTPYIRKP
jgi:hypothetical protein